MARTDVPKALSHLHPDLLSEIKAASIIKQIPKGAEILREGQYAKVVPIVLEGLMKVFTSYEDRELLLYYVKPNESCIMTFAASFDNQPMKIFALAEEDTTLLLLPVDKVAVWRKQYPDFNTLFFQQYNLRYGDLLDKIHNVLFERMDKRVYDYLKEKVELTKKNPLRISHRQIATELGTAREVVSRTIKKLEAEGKVKQYSNKIEFL
jgi:CRP/FNR family transcriptional regulator